MALIDMSETYQMTNVGDHIDGTDVYQSNRNLLDNPFFRINQRSFTSQDFGSSGNGNTVDRWKAYRSVVSVQEGLSLNVTPNSNDYGIAQFIEADRLVVGKVYTVSVDIGGTIYSWTFTYSTSAEYSPRAADGTRFYRHTGSNKVDIWICGYANTTYNVRSVKLELGSVSTLANDAPPDDGTELLKCMRYFIRINAPYYNNGFGIGRATGGTTCLVFIPLPVPLRASPTVSYNAAGNLQLIGNGSNHSVTALAYSGRSEAGVNLSVTTSGISVNHLYFLTKTSQDCYIDLSADL